MYREKLDVIVNEVIDTVLKKNKDYGNSYTNIRNKFGDLAFVVRIADKYYRLETLLNGRKPDVNESVEDTIKDMIGYCLLELQYRSDNKGYDTVLKEVTDVESK